MVKLPQGKPEDFEEFFSRKWYTEIDETEVLKTRHNPETERGSRQRTYFRNQI